MNSTRWNKGDKVLSSANTLFIWCFRSRRRGCCLSSLSTSGSGVEFLSHSHSSHTKSLFAYTCDARDIPPPQKKKNNNNNNNKKQQQQQNKTKQKKTSLSMLHVPPSSVHAVISVLL